MVYLSIYGTIDRTSSSSSSEDIFYSMKIMVRVIAALVFCICMRLMFPFSYMTYGFCCRCMHRRFSVLLLKRPIPRSSIRMLDQVPLDSPFGYNSLQAKSLQT